VGLGCGLNHSTVSLCGHCGRSVSCTPLIFLFVSSFLCSEVKSKLLVPTSWAHVRHGPRSTILDLEASYGPSGPSDELDGPKSLAHRQSETVSHSHRPPPHLPAVTPVPSRRAFPPPAREPPPAAVTPPPGACETRTCKRVSPG
jgi:hypothetical protein